MLKVAFGLDEKGKLLHTPTFNVNLNFSKKKTDEINVLVLLLPTWMLIDAQKVMTGC